MSKRTDKAESQVLQTVAIAIRERVTNPACITVTAVDVSPDLRQAVVWLGIIDKVKPEQLFAEAVAELPYIQSAVAKRMTTKFIPKIELRRDLSGEYASKINGLIKGLN